MYQFSTYFPLAKSKQYFDSIRQCSKHLRKCIIETNAYRLKNGQRPIDLTELHLGMSLLRIHLDTNPNAMKFLGEPVAITTKNLDKSSEENNKQESEVCL
jgi:hypothetical protein